MSGVVFLLGNLTGGGSETKMVRMANRFAKSGQDVHVIYLGAPHTLRDSIDSAVAVECLERRGKFSIRALRKLRDYIRQHDIDVVFCVNHYPLVYGWPACRFGGRRYCVAAMNTYEFTSLRDRFFMLIYAFVLRRCDRVVFGSRAQQELWVDKYRLDRARSQVIYNGVDVDYFANGKIDCETLGQTIGVNEQSVVIGCVAHLRPEKSHMDLLEAFNAISRRPGIRAHLLLVGQGPEEERLREYVEASGLGEVVHFCGRADDVRPFLALMDVFVLPSSSEVFSNAILEAMAMGCPVICSAVGGSVEMVLNNETGLTYERHDVEGLTAKLTDLITDLDKRQALGHAGAVRVTNVFSIEKMDEQYAAVVRLATEAPRDT